MWFIVSYILLILVQFLQYYTAILEGKSKINPLSTYTTWYFGLYFLLNAISTFVFTIYYMHNKVIVCFPNI
jgi:hypothetical protein